ncbi:MAG: hypothetical protein BGN83_16025 [Rhizobium sp. 63-7]|nr:MAG: hypothetical protein BGN83_16025 [Rhizobium sp. 63-7]
MLRTPDGMRQELKAEAEKNGRSLNAEIVTRLKTSLTGGAAAGGTSCGDQHDIASIIDDLIAVEDIVRLMILAVQARSMASDEFKAIETVADIVSRNLESIRIDLKNAVQRGQGRCCGSILDAPGKSEGYENGAEI